MTAVPSPLFHSKYVVVDSPKFSEEELVCGLYTKDKNAFSYLYNHYAGALNAVISKSILDKNAAEDVLQEVFIKIWMNFSQYDKSKGRLYIWMLTITRNLVIDILKSKGHKNSLVTDQHSEQNAWANEKCEFARFDSLRIHKHLRVLPNDENIIIHLAYFNGMTNQEISDHMGMPLGTVKTKMRSAIKALRKNIN